MKNPITWVILILLAALGAWYLSIQLDQQEIEQAEVSAAPAIVPLRSPQPQYPVERISTPEPAEAQPPAPAPLEPPADPLPTLAESDPEVLERAAELWPGGQLDALLVPEFLLSRIVATVDGLDARQLPQPMRPLQPAPGRFQVLESNGEAVMSPANGERYRAHLQLLDAVSIESLLPLYLRYYPLLQEAYLGLGYEDVYFNDRVVAIIDHLLATPEPVGMLELQQNEAVYEFVDPQLEALSVGQKMLLRLAPEDRVKVMQRLREARTAITGTMD